MSKGAFNIKLLEITVFNKEIEMVRSFLNFCGVSKTNVDFKKILNHLTRVATL